MRVDPEKRTIEVHQSDLNSWMKCPEQFRLKALVGLPDPPSDAAALGTCLHTFVEHVLDGASADRAAEAAQAQFREMLDEIRWVQVQQVETFLGHLKGTMVSWWLHVRPLLGRPVATEVMLRSTIGIVNGWKVAFAGTVDAIIEHRDEYWVWDWKTTNSFQRWAQWEIDRFHIQPSVYLDLVSSNAHKLGIAVPEGFKYAVIQRSVDSNPSRVRVFTTRRHEGELSWVRSQALHLARQVIESVDPPSKVAEPWQTNDQGWHCSEKWCPAWHMCKGAALGFSTNTKETTDE